MSVDRTPARVPPAQLVDDAPISMDRFVGNLVADAAAGAMAERLLKESSDLIRKVMKTEEDLLFFDSYHHRFRDGTYADGVNAENVECCTPKDNRSLGHH